MRGNYTKVPKWVMAAAIQRQLSPRHLSVLFFFTEKTHGFNREWFKADAKTINEATSIGLSHAYEVTKDLVSKGYLRQSSEGYGVPLQAPGNSQSGSDANSQSGSKSLPEREQITPKVGVKRAPKTADDAGSGNAKKLSKKTSKKIPPTPQGGTGGFVYPEWFEKVWAAGPWKEGKKPTYLAASKYKPDEAMVTAFLEGIARWQLSKRWAEGYVCHGTTFFNQERWKEYPEQAGKVVNIAPSEKTPEANPWESKPWAALWVGFANLPRRGSMRDIVEWLASKGRSLDWYDYDEQRALVKTFYEQGEDAALSRYWSMVPKKKEA